MTRERSMKEDSREKKKNGAETNGTGPPLKPLPTRATQSFLASAATINLGGLSWPSSGAQVRKDESTTAEGERLAKLSGAVKTMLECVGENPSRKGLLRTSERFAKTMLFFTKGYQEILREIINGAVFEEDHEELVVVRDIEFSSLCEHHLVPFSGKMHIGYIPDGRVIGLSKIARIVEMFSRRLQLQERLTKQVSEAIFEILQPQGVAVVVEASHLCMVMRGVQKTGASTTTSCMRGCFRENAKTREEFLRLVGRN